MPAVIYTRDTGVEGEGNGFQLAELSVFCEEEEIQIRAEFSEQDSSSRSALWSAVNALRKGDNLLVYSREVLGSGDWLLDFLLIETHRKGAGVYVPGEEITNATQTDTFMSYLDELRKATASDTMRRYQAKGRRMSKMPPYGYKANPEDPALLIPDDYEQKVLFFISALRDKGLSYRKCCEELACEGYKARSGQDWDPSFVRKVYLRSKDTFKAINQVNPA